MESHICFALKLQPYLSRQHDGVAWVRGFSHVACWPKPWTRTLSTGTYADISGTAQLSQITISLRHPSSSLEAAQPGRCAVLLPALNWLACCRICEVDWTESSGNGRPDLGGSAAWIPLQFYVLTSLLSMAQTKETDQAHSDNVQG